MILLCVSELINVLKQLTKYILSFLEKTKNVTLRTHEHVPHQIRNLLFYVVIQYNKMISKERIMGEVSRGAGMILKTLVFTERRINDISLFIHSFAIA